MRRKRKNSRNAENEARSNHARAACTKLNNDNLFCTECNKKIYTMKFEAEYIRQELINSGRVGYLEIYICPHKKGFHLTSKA